MLHHVTTACKHWTGFKEHFHGCVDLVFVRARSARMLGTVAAENKQQVVTLAVGFIGDYAGCTKGSLGKWKRKWKLP